MSCINYRELTDTDAAAVSELRLSVLKSNPETFSISIDEENKGSIDSLKQALATYHRANDREIIGAFGSSLAGMIGIERFQGDYTRHKTRIWGLYVAQNYRNAGIATALLTQSISFAERLDGVEKLMLEVTSAATDALRLYESFVFSIVGSERNALRIGNRYIDLHRMELSLN